MTVFRVPRRILEGTFEHFRHCGRGRRECQALWTSAWHSVDSIDRVVHPEHASHGGGFELDDHWLNSFWLELANSNAGIRVQIHTHPRQAFHSSIDDDYPIIHKPGFLSLVIPNFALGPVGFADAYLTEIQEDGRWKQVAIASRLVLT